MKNIVRDTHRSFILVLFSLIVISFIISCEEGITDIDDNDDQLPLVGIWDWLYSHDPRTSDIYSPETENYTHHLIFSGYSVAIIFYYDSFSR